MLRRRPVLFPAAMALLLLSGCASLDVAREIQSGRRALQTGNPKAAVPHFSEAARLNPDYVTDFTLADVGVWTYLGRSYYEAGNVGDALASFEKAKERHKDDHLGRIYWGLLRSQAQEAGAGRAELENGLKGLKVWLEEVPGYGRRGQYWNPGNYLGNQVKETLAMLQAEEVDWKAVTDNVVRLGADFDDEIDEVKRDEDLDYDDGADPDTENP